MVNSQMLRGRWDEVRGKLRERWSELTDNELGEFSGDVQDLVGKIERKTGAARDSVEQYLNTIVDNPEKAMDQAREYVREGVDSVNQAFSEGMAEAEEFVQNRPGQAIGLAMGVGVVVGLLLSLLLRDRPTAAQRGRDSAEHVLRQLADAVNRWLPESLAHR